MVLSSSYLIHMLLYDFQTTYSSQALLPFADTFSQSLLCLTSAALSPDHTMHYTTVYRLAHKELEAAVATVSCPGGVLRPSGLAEGRRRAVGLSAVPVTPSAAGGGTVSRPSPQSRL